MEEEFWAFSFSQIHSIDFLKREDGCDTGCPFSWNTSVTAIAAVRLLQLPLLLSLLFLQVLIEYLLVEASYICPFML